MCDYLLIVVLDLRIAQVLWGPILKPESGAPSYVWSLLGIPSGEKFLL